VFHLRAGGSGVATLRRIRPLHATRLCPTTAHHRLHALPGIIGRRRFHALRRRFAPSSAVEITRFFAARALLTCQRSSRAVPNSDPPHLSAGRASRSLQALTFSVARTAGCESSMLAAGGDSSEEPRTHAARARDVVPACRLKPTSFATQNAFD